MQVDPQRVVQVVMLGVLVLALPVAAQPAAPEYPGETVRYDYAQVLRADPIYQAVLVSEQPYQECDEASAYRRVGPERASTGSVGGTVVGAVIGGVLGNQVGKGDGRTAATVGGAVIGGAIGNRVGTGAGGYHDDVVQPSCRTVVSQRQERRVVGYDVEYRYRGDVFMSRLDYDPGTQLRIRVVIAPADEAR